MKTRDWERARRILKLRFQSAGITSCELRWHGCWRDNALGFAHSLKRRNIKGDQIYEVILACNSCHDTLDCRAESETYRIVREVINTRKRKVDDCTS